MAVEVLLLRSDPIYFLNDRKNVEKAKGSAAVLGTVKGVRSHKTIDKTIALRFAFMTFAIHFVDQIRADFFKAFQGPDSGP